jgi:multimeric flavodoxin WrbA
MEKVKVKILGVSGAYRPGMNTAWYVQYALKAAEKVGRRLSEVVDVETELIDLATMEIKLCLSECMSRCMPNSGRPYKAAERIAEGCPIDDDDFALKIAPKLREADGYIFGSPVFGLSVTAKLNGFWERCTPLLWEGTLTYKPAASVATGEVPRSGSEVTLADLNRRICGAEMMCVSWGLGVNGFTGPPIGPAPGDPDYNTRIGAKGDRLGMWLAVVNGRRVADTAIMAKLAKQQLGEIYNREFYLVCHPPHGEEPWAWRRLDPEDEQFMQGLESSFTVK